MNKKCLLSIAVPMYNMEQYIRRCLESIIVLEYSGLYEVLVINDGSTDNSFKIALEYQEKYPEVFKVIDKSNGNWGSCNNLAIKEAKGIYLRVLDADDYFSIDDTRNFIKCIMNLDEEVDIIQTKCCTVFNDKTSPVFNDFKNIEYNHIYNVEQLIFGFPHLLYSHHTATLNLKLLKKNHILLQEKMSYTDLELYTYSLTFAQNVVFFDLVLYRYFIGREGQSVSIESYRKNIAQIERLFKRMLDCRETYIAPPKTNKILSQANYLSNILSVYCYLNLLDQTDKTNEQFKTFTYIWNNLKVKFPELIKTSSNMKKNGCKVILLWDKYHITCNQGIGVIIFMLTSIIYKIYIHLLKPVFNK